MSTQPEPKVPKHPLAALQKHIVSSTKVVVTDHASPARVGSRRNSYIPPMALITPFPDESHESLIQRYKDTIQSLVLPPFPLLSEESYYSYLVHENDFPRWSFAELVEIVDLVRENNFNFIVVSAKLKHRGFSPVSCLHAFQQYAHIILWRHTFSPYKYTLLGTDETLKQSYAQFNQVITILAFYANLSTNNVDLGDAEILRQFNLRVCLAATSPLRAYGKYTFTQTHQDILAGNIHGYPHRGDGGRATIAPIFREALINNIHDCIIGSISKQPNVAGNANNAPAAQRQKNMRQCSHSRALQNAIIQSANVYANSKQDGVETSKLKENNSLTSNMSEEVLAAMLPDFGIDIDFVSSEMYGFLGDNEAKLVEKPGREQRDIRIMRGFLGGLLTETAAEYKNICDDHPSRARSLPATLNLQVDSSLPKRINMTAMEQAEREIPIHVAQVNRYPMSGAMLLHPPKVRIPGHMRIDLPSNLAGGRYAKTSSSTTGSTTSTGAGSPYVMPPHAFSVSWRYRYFPRVERGRQMDQTVSVRHNMWHQDLPTRDHERKRAAIMEICNQMSSKASYIDFPTFVRLETYIEGLDS